MSEWGRSFRRTLGASAHFESGFRALVSMLFQARSFLLSGEVFQSDMWHCVRSGHTLPAAPGAHRPLHPPSSCVHLAQENGEVETRRYCPRVGFAERQVHRRRSAVFSRVAGPDPRSYSWLQHRARGKKKKVEARETRRETRKRSGSTSAIESSLRHHLHNPFHSIWLYSDRGSYPT